ncbi:fucose isomerase [Alicyclobacillus hesperidum subsp. aegles]|uniref:RbsD/FucU family protein n=1 Tax=Alicyclobacillus hesperidum TaxID=89784 RepID=UPI002228C2B8|nr:RbsD/FucU domain-containing protein [Alicyclobacillus hesperidum]GLG02810.1 fucose isomerase [Alicyclobacillus hesperidum subsp. aegles]
MLIGIPKIVSPDLLKLLMEMGHGDEIVLADANFPSSSICQRVIRADGHGVIALLDAILTLMPLDTYVSKPVTLMEKVPGDNIDTPIWGEIAQVINNRSSLTQSAIDWMDRYSFYDRARKAYAVVASGELSLYANVILTKGVVKELSC